MDNRELDRLVAEKVMGWTTQDCAGMIWWLKPDVEPSIDNTHLENELSFGPSSDLAAAWEVVEKLSPDWGIDMCNWQMDWKVDCISRTSSSNRHWASHESLPLAICLAALKAVGVELPQ